MSWPTVPIKEVCLYAVDCPNRTAPIVDYDTPYKMLRTTNVRGGFVDTRNLRCVTRETYEKWTRRLKPQVGDIILTREAPLGDVGRLTSDEQVFLGQRLFHYRANPEKLDSRFLAYVLQSNQVQGWIKGVGFGATVQHAKVADFLKIPIPLPPLTIQSRIGQILSTYDDLIENNRRRIALLEEAARQLYKEWFVRFRFPGHEHVKIIDGVPEGWSRKNLFEVATATYGHAFKSELFSNEPIGRPIVRIRDVPDRSSETWTTEDAPVEKIVDNGDFLIGMDGDFHMNFWAGGTAWLNQRVVRLLGKGCLSTGLLRNSIEKQIKDLNETITGTTVKHLGAKHLKQIELLIPPTILLNQANEFCDSIRNMVVNLSVGNLQLAKTRDLLLPKLMSGAIAI